MSDTLMASLFGCPCALLTAFHNSAIHISGLGISLPHCHLKAAHDDAFDGPRAPFGLYLSVAVAVLVSDDLTLQVGNHSKTFVQQS